MLTVCTLFWDANRHSESFSSMYSTEWVERLYRGFASNLTVPWRFVCYTDREREFGWPIEQVRLKSAEPSYADCIQPYEMNVPMILVGLDTVVTGNLDHMAEYCMRAREIALPLDPYNRRQVCNGVALVPAGMEHIAKDHRGENDMEWLRKQPHKVIDELFPGQVQSFKGHVEANGLGDTRLCYFHGLKKPHELGSVPWVKEHWA